MKKQSLQAVIGSRIRAARQAKDWTQTELGDKAKLSVSYVSMLERGDRTPHLDTLVAVSTVLKMPLAKLFAGV